MKCKQLLSPRSFPIYYTGLGPEAGPLPAFVYFSLSGEESLCLPPYNQPAIVLDPYPLRVFSFTLPFHGEGFNKLDAMKFWVESIQSKNGWLDEFLENVHEAVLWLMRTEMIDKDSVGVGGLSRGAFIATHLAAREPSISSLLGFSPVTRFQNIQEFATSGANVDLEAFETINLTSLIPNLLHLKHLRFYIGNLDLRVNTDSCYDFIRKMAIAAHEKRARNCHVELRITQSIGHKGHGTAPETFEEGALWIKNHLLSGE